MTQISEKTSSIGLSDWLIGSQETPMPSPWIRAGWWGATDEIQSYKSQINAANAARRLLSDPSHTGPKEPYPSRHYSLNDDINTVLMECGQDNWDGEGALAISTETADIARSLIPFFSSTNLLPDVNATPHGEIDFSFDISEDTLLTIRSCPSGDIVFSGIFREGDLTQEMSRFMNAFFKGLNNAAHVQIRSQQALHLTTTGWFVPEITYDEEGMVMP